jgi:hypothetical protein
MQQTVESEIEELRRELREQWEHNHWERCRAEWPHSGVCFWPYPEVLGELEDHSGGERG